MIVDSEELRAAIRERDAAIERVRAVEAGLLPLVEAMWTASRRVEEMANPQAAE
jgi:outer membrane protein TolC